MVNDLNTFLGLAVLGILGVENVLDGIQFPDLAKMPFVKWMLHRKNNLLIYNHRI